MCHVFVEPRSGLPWGRLLQGFLLLADLEITGVTMTITSSTIGFPRIGPNREMKKALERYGLNILSSRVTSSCKQIP